MLTVYGPTLGFTVLRRLCWAIECDAARYPKISPYANSRAGWQGKKKECITLMNVTHNVVLIAMWSIPPSGGGSIKGFIVHVVSTTHLWCNVCPYRARVYSTSCDLELRDKAQGYKTDTQLVDQRAVDV